MATNQRDTDKEVLGTLPETPGELWVDNNSTWVLKRSGQPKTILAWDTETGARKRDQDFLGLFYNGNRSPGGIWADGSELSLSDYVDSKVFAYLKHFEQGCPTPARNISAESGARQASWRRRRRSRHMVRRQHHVGVRTHVRCQDSTPTPFLRRSYLPEDKRLCLWSASPTPWPWSRWTLQDWYVASRATGEPAVSVVLSAPSPQQRNHLRASRRRLRVFPAEGPCVRKPNTR